MVDKYEFNMNDPASWVKMPKPHLEEWFVNELNRIGGLNKRGRPRFRIIWGMDEEVYIEGDLFIQSGHYPKYWLGSNKELTGYRWTENGVKCFAKDQKDIPKHVLTALPLYRLDMIGTPRWIIEEWREAGDAGGVYDQAGYYHHRKIVEDDQPDNPESFLKPYRDPDQRDLDLLAHYVQVTANLTENDIKVGVAADREREAELAAQQKAEVKEEITESIVKIASDMRNL